MFKEVLKCPEVSAKIGSSPGGTYTIWSSLGDGAKLGRAVRTGTDLYGPVRIRTERGRPINVQTQQLEEIGSWCKNKARYGQAVRTIDRTCSGSTRSEEVQR